MLRRKAKTVPVEKPDDMSVMEWCELLSTHMAEEVYKLFEREYPTIGKDNYRHLASSFLAGIISALVLRSLTVMPAKLKTKQEQYDYARTSFADMKHRIQEAVAAGFSGGMYTWSGKSAEYYCEVKPVPEPINRNLC